VWIVDQMSLKYITEMKCDKIDVKNKSRVRARGYTNYWITSEQSIKRDFPIHVRSGKPNIFKFRIKNRIWRKKGKRFEILIESTIHAKIFL